MPKILIRCTRKVTYSKQIEVTEEQLIKLNNAPFQEVDRYDDDTELFELLDGLISSQDIFDEADAFKDIEIEEDEQ